MNSIIHDTGLRLMSELLIHGYTEDTLPLPQGKIKSIVEQGAEFTEQDLDNLRHAYNDNHKGQTI